MARLAQQLAALATLSPEQLRADWAAVHGSPAPAVSTDLLRRMLGHRMQERQHGGLSPAAERALRGASNGIAPSTSMRAKTGARLVRSWQGRTYSVLVTEQGYSFEDRTYRSLSQIAREITGAHWSGPRFFGLADRG